MSKLKIFAALAALSTVLAAGPSVADPVYYHHRHYYHPGPVGAAADAAGAIVGGAIGTAGAIASAPFRSSYNYDYYGSNMGPSGFACRPGTWFKGDDGRRHICQ
jgi:hypothetical protein